MLEDITINGDKEALLAFFSLFDQYNYAFDIMTLNA